MRHGRSNGTKTPRREPPHRRKVSTTGKVAMLITAAAIGIAQSARGCRRGSSWRRALPSCRCLTSTSCSRCRRRSAPSSITTRPPSTTSCSRRAPRPADDRRGPQAPRCEDRLHLGAAHVGQCDDASSARHMIVPGGGISLDGSRWISSGQDLLCPCLSFHQCSVARCMCC
jgi:hypothetical protein